MSVASFLDFVGPEDSLIKQEFNPARNLEDYLSIFRSGYTKYNPYVMGLGKINPQGGTPSYGDTIEWLIPRNANLLGYMMLELKLSALSQTGGTYIRFVDKIGWAFWKELTLTVGPNRIDRRYSRFANVWEELSAKKAELKAREEIGEGTVIERNEAASKVSTYNVPLNLYFQDFPHLYLPLDALGNGDIRMQMTTRALSELVEQDGTSPVGTISSAILKPLLISLPHWEIPLHAAPKSQLIKSIWPIQDKTVTTSDQDVSFTLNLLHPVMEIICVFEATANTDANDYFNYSVDRTAISGGTAVDAPIEKLVELEINGQKRWEDIPEAMLRSHFPKLFHSNKPNDFIYVLPESFSPEAYNPIGGLNYSRASTATVKFRFNEVAGASSYFAGKAHFYAVTTNFIKYSNGTAQIAFNAGV